MTAKEILYFDRPGPKNTLEVVKAVKDGVKELGIEYIVIASNTGKTTLKFWEALKGTGVKLVSVAEHAGYDGGDEIPLSQEKKRELERKGIEVLVCSHALSGVGRSITQKFGGISHVEIIAHTLRLFGGEGIKVAVEVSIMAADAGLIPTDREIIAVAGSGSGADSAIVLKAAHMNNFFDLEIREIIAKPRQRRKK
ncbi:MAG: hypothetical protein HY882_01665 [Deltaproteobacteria bacterium]|nr:hypothetical protein [Deltaproteobacteria bacterium]